MQLLILDYTLPPPLVPLDRISTLSSTTSWSTFRERADSLRCYCLVTKQWLDWAQAELTRHVVLESDLQLRRFLLLGRPRLRLSIETLRIGGVRAGRQLDGTAISELFRNLHAQSRDSGIREVWIVQVDHLDLRHLCHLDSESPPAHNNLATKTEKSILPQTEIRADLRALLCVSVSLAVHRTATDDPTPAPRPVSPSPARFPHLHTLVLQKVHISPMMRTILYESHAFDQLRVLAFDGAEVLEQVFDGNPDGLPRLVAMRPSHDLGFDYYTALDRETAAPGEEGSHARAGDGDGDRADSTSSLDADARFGLLYLNASADFLHCIEHYAPWLPDSITRFSLDLDDPAEDHSEGSPACVKAVDAYRHLVYFAQGGARAAFHHPVGEEEDEEGAAAPGQVALFIENLEELILASSTCRNYYTDLMSRLDPDSDLMAYYNLQQFEAAEAEFLAHLRDKDGVEVVEPPVESCVADVTAEQDRLIPWRFLIEADQTVRSLDATAGSRS